MLSGIKNALGRPYGALSGELNSEHDAWSDAYPGHPVAARLAARFRPIKDFPNIVQVPLGWEDV
jgi:hypothetical protein